MDPPLSQCISCDSVWRLKGWHVTQDLVLGISLAASLHPLEQYSMHAIIKALLLHPKHCVCRLDPSLPWVAPDGSLTSGELLTVQAPRHHRLQMTRLVSKAYFPSTASSSILPPTAEQGAAESDSSIFALKWSLAPSGNQGYTDSQC